MNSSQGNVAQGSFAVVCTDGDSQCSTPGDQVALPGSVAVGSSLQVVYVGGQSAENAVTIRPASPVMALQDGLSIQFTAKGYCALLARNNAGIVVDLVHVRAEPIGELVTGGPSSLAVGESGELTVAPHGPQDDVLGGSLAYSWSSSAPSVAAVDTSSHGTSTKVLAVGPGVTTIRVATGATESTLELTISEAP